MIIIIVIIIIIIIIFSIIISKIPCEYSKLNRNILFSGETPENIYIFWIYIYIHIYIQIIQIYIKNTISLAIFFFYRFLFLIYIFWRNEQTRKKKTKRMIDRVMRASINEIRIFVSYSQIELKNIFFVFRLLWINRMNSPIFYIFLYFFIFLFFFYSYFIFCCMIIAIHKAHDAHGRHVLTIIFYSQRNVRYNTCDRVPSMTNESLYGTFFAASCSWNSKYFVEDNAIYFI